MNISVPGPAGLRWPNNRQWGGRCACTTLLAPRTESQAHSGPRPKRGFARLMIANASLPKLRVAGSHAAWEFQARLSIGASCYPRMRSELKSQQKLSQTTDTALPHCQEKKSLGKLRFAVARLRQMRRTNNRFCVTPNNGSSAHLREIASSGGAFVTSAASPSTLTLLDPRYHVNALYTARS
jgi:hypothetical protein